MMIPLSIAEKLLLLAGGKELQASKMRHALIDELVAEGIIAERLAGRTKSTLFVADNNALQQYLYNKFSIPDIGEYIAVLRKEDATRAEQILVSSNSKTVNRRTFKGFLVNSYMPLACTLHGKPFTIHPLEGTFQFVHDFEHFIPAPDVVVVGVENAENFRYVEKQKYLFGDLKTLFVSRYPQEQNKDLIKWLLSIPNTYLHMGDYDFAGINIYMQEYKKHLKERASFFIPGNIEQLLADHGNSALYDKQKLFAIETPETEIQKLIALIHKHKKGLEQEVLLIAK